MPNRRNFNPERPASDYEHAHIKFTAVLEVELHNVGPDFSLVDAPGWLAQAIEKGLKQMDPNDLAKIIDTRLISRPACQCYSDSLE